MADLGAFFGNPNIQRQGARARALAAQRDVNTLADPLTYAAVQGLLGTRPDEMGFSVLNPDYEKIKKVAEPAFALGLLGQAAPALAPLTKGLPVGASIKEITPALNQQMAKEAAERIGQSANPYTRSLQQGYDYGWYHGSTGDIKAFDKGLLGEATGAESAKKGFFFARDPQNPPAAMLQKSTDPKSIEFLKKQGKTDEEIAALNTVSMKGYGAETASGYAQIGGSREYRDAMRKAKAAEKRGNWDEYEKQMLIAEDSEIKRMNDAQLLVAKYGDARDTMTEKINQTFYNLQHPQAQAELLDKKYKELMPYGWYNTYTPEQFNNLKTELVDLVGEKAAKSAIKEIDNFKAIAAERALIDKTQEGGNVMPVALRYENPMVYDFKGQAYREQSYNDLVEEAKRKGHDALILQNTFDAGSGTPKLVDVGVVFEPNQIRSKFAAFDPTRTKEADILAGVVPLGLLADEEKRKEIQSLLE